MGETARDFRIKARVTQASTRDSKGKNNNQFTLSYMLLFIQNSTLYSAKLCVKAKSNIGEGSGPDCTGVCSAAFLSPLYCSKGQ